MKIVIASETSLYTIDVKKVEIEKLVTLQGLKSVKLGANDAFIIDEKGNLVIINLLLKTSLGAPVKLGPVEDFKINPDGTSVFILTPENELKIYRRSSGQTESLATDVREFEISPEEKRIVAFTADNKLKIAHLEEFKGDVRREAGAVLEILIASRGNVKNLSWLAAYPNYVMFLNGDNLIVQETDAREPVNSHSLFEGILDYKIDGKKLYLLKENGELIVSAIVEAS